jgi:geranylgeranyl pyrophosphate synthase
VHRRFDEATAILAADALQPLAFSVLAQIANVPADVRIRLVNLLAEACGSIGMTGGQAIDLASEGRTLAPDALEHMYALKTGALIRAAVVCPCLLQPDLPRERAAALDGFAHLVGIAFQIRDDMLDIEGETGVIGKPAGSDAGLEKATFPALFGMDAARERCAELLGAALDRLELLGADAAPLRWLARYIVDRHF